MKDMERLEGASPNPLTRALLRSAKGDAPSEGARHRAALAIGVAAGTAATATKAAAGAAGAGKLTSGVAGSGGAAKWLASIGAWKILGATVVSGAVVAGVVHERAKVALAPMVSAPIAVASNVAPRAKAPRAALPAEPRVEAPEPPVAEVAPVAEAPAHSPSESIARAPVPAAKPFAVHRGALPRASDPLREELVLLDRARGELVEGDARAALADVQAYRRSFPRGALGEEATLLHIEALGATGDRGAAVAEAKRFLARDEEGPHARRVRAWLNANASEAP
jgi:hypothetical protein